MSRGNSMDVDSDASMHDDSGSATPSRYDDAGSMFGADVGSMFGADVSDNASSTGGATPHRPLGPPAAIARPSLDALLSRTVVRNAPVPAVSSTAAGATTRNARGRRTPPVEPGPVPVRHSGVVYPVDDEGVPRDHATMARVAAAAPPVTRGGGGDDDAADIEALNALMNEANPFANDARYRRGTAAALPALTPDEEQVNVEFIDRVWRQWRQVTFNVPLEAPETAQPVDVRPDRQLMRAYSLFNDATISGLQEDAARTGGDAARQLNNIREAQRNHLPATAVTPQTLEKYQRTLLASLHDKFEALQLRPSGRMTAAASANVEKKWRAVQAYVMRYVTMVNASFAVNNLDVQSAVEDARSFLNLTHELVRDKPLIQFKIVMMAKLRQAGFRRGPLPGMLYREFRTTNRDGQLIRTHFYKPEMEFMQWLNLDMSLENGNSALATFVLINNVANSYKQALLKSFIACTESELRTVVPSDRFYSLNNGLFEFLENRFYPYDSVAYKTLIDPNLVSYKFFPSDGPLGHTIR